MSIGPPPKTIIQPDGKEYYEAEAMKQHLRELRAEIARLQYSVQEWKLIATAPR